MAAATRPGSGRAREKAADPSRKRVPRLRRAPRDPALTPPGLRLPTLPDTPSKGNRHRAAHPVFRAPGSAALTKPDDEVTSPAGIYLTRLPNMSAENSQSPVGPSPLHSPTTSQQSTQTFSSEEEDAEEEKESPKEEPSFSKEDEFLGENGYVENYPEEDEYLQEAQFLTAEGYLYARDYLYKNQYLKWREYLQKEVGSNGQDYWYENDYPESRENLQEEVASKEQDYWYENDYPESRENLQEEVASKEQDYLYENDYLQRGKPQAAAPGHRAPAGRPSTTLRQPPSPDTKWPPSPGRGRPQPVLMTAPALCSTGPLVPHDTPQGAGNVDCQGRHDGHAGPVASTSQATGTSQATTLFAVPTPASESTSEPYYDLVPLASFTKDGREFVIWKDKSTQTEWLYKTNVYVITEMPGEENEELTAVKPGSGEGLQDSRVNEPADMLDSLVNEPADMLEVDDIDLLNPKVVDMPTITYHFGSQSSEVEEPEKQEVKKPRHVVRRKKKLEIDTEWIKDKIEVHQGDAKLDLYPNKDIFQILFPDGSGQIYYPSRNLALLILSSAESKFTYIILEDSKEMQMQALVNNSGHATFHDDNREIWLSLSPNLGYYFAKDQAQKAWNWWNLSDHVHAPPIRPISLRINQYIEVQIRSQDKITFCFTHQKQHIYLNLGTKYKGALGSVCRRLQTKAEVAQIRFSGAQVDVGSWPGMADSLSAVFVTPDMLSEMKSQVALEVDAGPWVRKIRVLLGKMSRVVNFLTISELENFLEATGILLIDNTSLTEKFRSRVEVATTLVPGSFSSY
ncbi:glutamate-rich protein 6B [Pteropus medius]|uniref:glutamate-rich protein 6B n=1 Tax=Pteropus vampyrus TaxID=132908 RepID=UPI00196B8E7D|nr:glutamate-rich protein 6B [Pteropus giganteus]